MLRIAPVNPDSATPAQQDALNELKDAWGAVPNLGGVVARSPALTRAMLAYDAALATGTFAGAVGEHLAIAVANENGCRYCLAAHTAAARARGVSAQDASDARRGRAPDPRVAAALTFAQVVVRERGHVSDLQLAEARRAGLSDDELVELVGHAIATTLTNYMHHLSDVPVDFPAVEVVETLADEEAAA